MFKKGREGKCTETKTHSRWVLIFWKLLNCRHGGKVTFWLTFSVVWLHGICNLKKVLSDLFLETSSSNKYLSIATSGWTCHVLYRHRSIHQCLCIQICSIVFYPIGWADVFSNHTIAFLQKFSLALMKALILFDAPQWPSVPLFHVLSPTSLPCFHCPEVHLSSLLLIWLAVVRNPHGFVFRQWCQM